MRQGGGRLAQHILAPDVNDRVTSRMKAPGPLARKSIVHPRRGWCGQKGPAIFDGASYGGLPP